jgi:hypothetical protein
MSVDFGGFSVMRNGNFTKKIRALRCFNFVANDEEWLTPYSLLAFPCVVYQEEEDSYGWDDDRLRAEVRRRVTTMHSLEMIFGDGGFLFCVAEFSLSVMK